MCSSGRLKRISESFAIGPETIAVPSGQDNTCGKRFGWQLGQLPCATITSTSTAIWVTTSSRSICSRHRPSATAQTGCFIAARRANHARLLEDAAAIRRVLVACQADPRSEPSCLGSCSRYAPKRRSRGPNWSPHSRVATSKRGNSSPAICCGSRRSPMCRIGSSAI